MFRQQIVYVLLCAFSISLITPIPQAQARVETIHELSLLPAPGTMVSLSAPYQPAIIRGVTVHKDNPFLFDFIVDVGQDKLKGQALKEEGERLIKYFLATLAIPEKDLWVNLSPYEKDRIIPKALGQTDMGRDLLAQDYILKQITASLIYPEKSIGKEFWNRVYAKAGNVSAKGGSASGGQIPVNIFNKIWIMADKAEVYEHGQSAFVVSCHLKVMLEEDYLALNKNNVGAGSCAGPTCLGWPQGAAPTKDTSQIIRDIILPELEHEVNQGKNFAQLRQIFNSIILASWYKNNLKESILNQVYANQSKVKGIDLEDQNIKQEIYNRYLQAYKKGVFNYIKDTDTPNGVSGPRKYFSGGVSPAMAAHPRRTLHVPTFIRALFVIMAVRLFPNLPERQLNPNIERGPHIEYSSIQQAAESKDAAMRSISVNGYEEFIQATIDRLKLQSRFKSLFLKDIVLIELRSYLSLRNSFLRNDKAYDDKPLKDAVIRFLKQSHSIDEEITDLFVQARSIFDELAQANQAMSTGTDKLKQILINRNGKNIPFSTLELQGLFGLEASYITKIIRGLRAEGVNINTGKIEDGDKIAQVRHFKNFLIGFKGKKYSSSHALRSVERLSKEYDLKEATIQDIVGLLNEWDISGLNFTFSNMAMIGVQEQNLRQTDGGINLRTSGIQWNIHGDSTRGGSAFGGKVDQAMLEMIRQEGIESLTPEIIGITPFANVDALIGKGG